MAADRVNSMREGLWEGRAGTMDQNGDGRTLATSNSILSASTSNVINASGTIISATGGAGGATASWRCGGGGAESGCVSGGGGGRGGGCGVPGGDEQGGARRGRAAAAGERPTAGGEAASA